VSKNDLKVMKGSWLTRTDTVNESHEVILRKCGEDNEWFKNSGEK